MELLAALDQQARACDALGSPMYGALLRALGADAAGGGPTAHVLRGHENDPGPSALGLRLLGSLHRLVLTDRAPAVAEFYPSVGGRWDDEAGPAAVQAHFAAEPEAVREWLDRAPQTNEVGRAASLYGALLHVNVWLRLPVRLFEIGASGGLNLLADRFRYLDAGGSEYGDTDSPVALEPAWHPAPLERWSDLSIALASRCDLHPVPVATAEGQVQLTAYVWPDQARRLARLRGALELAAAKSPEVHAQGAGDFVDAMDLEPDTLTVLWHSVMWQYLPGEEQDRIHSRIAELGQHADARMPLAHIRLEPARRTPQGRHEFLVRLTTWPGGDTRILGTAAPHGLPVTWEN